MAKLDNQATSSALPGAGVDSDISTAAAITGAPGNVHVSRSGSLGEIVRRSAENLREGAERDLKLVAQEIKDAVSGPEFALILGRTLQNRLPEKLLEALKSSNQGVVPVEALRSLIHSIADRGAEHFQTQRDAYALPSSRMTLDSLFGSPKLTKDLLQAFCVDHLSETKHHQAFTGQIRQLLADVTGTALVATGHTIRERGGEQGIVFVSSLGLSYLKRLEIAATKKQRGEGSEKAVAAAERQASEGARSDPEVRDAIRLGFAARSQDLSQVGDFLIAIEGMPRMPTTELRDMVARQATRRMQRALAEILVRHPEDRIGAEHFKTIEIFKEMFARPDVRFHPYKGDNDAAIVDAVYSGLKAKKLTLSVVSCPDYSGSIQTDPQSGKPFWVYDFKSLGSDTGSVAKRGFDYVKAWHQVLSRPENIGPNVSIVHWEATFEIATGFHSRTDDHSGDLSYETAVEHLRASGEAVKQLYAGAGITIESRLTRESLSDPEFIREKKRLGQVLLEQSASDPRLREMMEEVNRGRRVLYQEWYPPLDGENAEAYRNRIAEEIVPQNVAEYILLGSILSSAAKNTLVLAYDSPKMGETYALRGLPVISGQGAQAMNYAGA